MLLNVLRIGATRRAWRWGCRLGCLIPGFCEKECDRSSELAQVRLNVISRSEEEAMMGRLPQVIGRSCCLVTVLILCAVGAKGRQNAGELSGRVNDELGAVVTGARVTAIDAKGVGREATTNDNGNYLIEALAAGKYTLRVVAQGFSLYKNAAVEIAVGRREVVNIILTVATIKGEINID